MKKSKINLIISREDYQKYENIFFWIKIFFIILLIVFFVIFGTFYLKTNNESRFNSRLKEQNSALLEELQYKSGDEEKILYLQKKFADLRLYLKDDAYSSPYYSLLNSAIKESSQSSFLKSFKIDKNRQVDFTISFFSFPELSSFFRFIESNVFLNNFENISLKSFTVIGQDESSGNKENYELSFIGRFIPIKDFQINEKTTN